MSTEKSDALLLRVTSWSETSCVVAMFTRDFGRISAIAKGARRPKGPFEAAIDLLTECRIVFISKNGDSLDLLTEAKLLRRFRSNASNLQRLYVAYFVAEYLQIATEPNEPVRELYDLAADTLRVLSDPISIGTTADAYRSNPQPSLTSVAERSDFAAEPKSDYANADTKQKSTDSREAFFGGQPTSDSTEELSRFERTADREVISTVANASDVWIRFTLQSLRILGHLPSLDRCAACGDPVPNGSSLSFALLAGGVLCPECLIGQRQIIQISRDAAESMAKASQMGWQRGEFVAIPDHCRREVRAVLLRYLTNLFDREMRMAKLV